MRIYRKSDGFIAVHNDSQITQYITKYSIDGRTSNGDVYGNPIKLNPGQQFEVLSGSGRQQFVIFYEDIDGNKSSDSTII